MAIKRMMQTYVSEHVVIETDKLCKLSVAFDDFACPSPETGWDGHCGEYSVIVEEETFKRFFDEDEVLCSR